MNDFFYRSNPIVVRARVFDPDKMDEIKGFIEGEVEYTKTLDDGTVVYTLRSNGRNPVLITRGEVIVLDSAIARVYDVSTFDKLYKRV